jgi:hypothetical protein
LEGSCGVLDCSSLGGWGSEVDIQSIIVLLPLPPMTSQMA